MFRIPRVLELCFGFFWSGRLRLGKYAAGGLQLGFRFEFNVGKLGSALRKDPNLNKSKSF